MSKGSGLSLGACALVAVCMCFLSRTAVALDRLPLERTMREMQVLWLEVADGEFSGPFNPYVPHGTPMNWGTGIAPFPDDCSLGAGGVLSDEEQVGCVRTLVSRFYEERLWQYFVAHDVGSRSYPGKLVYEAVPSDGDRIYLDRDGNFEHDGVNYLTNGFDLGAAGSGAPPSLNKSVGWYWDPTQEEPPPQQCHPELIDENNAELVYINRDSEVAG